MMHVVICLAKSIVASKIARFQAPYLTKSIIIREYLNLGKISRFHLNHFDSENEIVISCQNSSTHVWWCSSLSRGPEIAQFLLATMAKRYKGRYHTSTGESNRSMCDDACCDFFGRRYKTDIAHRLELNRSMCDDAGCDFLAKRYKGRYRQSPKSPIPDCSFWPPNGVSWPCDHL